MTANETPREWQCQSSGDCCRIPSHVSMTFAERRELEAVAHLALRPLRFVYHDETAFTKMVAKPCPFVTDDNRCAAYDVRPFNCRRFGCMRPNVTAEKFSDVAAIERVRTPESLIQLQAMQAEAQPWAVAHGWKGEK